MSLVRVPQRKAVVTVERALEIERSRQQLPVVAMEQEVMEAILEHDVTVGQPVSVFLGDGDM